jgi:hypothetical protein
VPLIVGDAVFCGAAADAPAANTKPTAASAANKSSRTEPRRIHVFAIRETPFRFDIDEIPRINHRDALRTCGLTHFLPTFNGALTSPGTMHSLLSWC